MNTTTTSRTIAPCGCEFEGRFDYTWNCTVIDKDTWTGRQVIAHSTKVRKAAKA